MNNDAFRALVNKQRESSAAEKTTKEIAREAVENEFQKRHRRGGGKRGARGYDNGYGSDSGGSSDEDDGGRLPGKDVKQQEEDDVPEWKRRRKEKKIKDGDGSSSEYRDRAKERREGNNLDYAALQGLTQSGEVDRKRQAELSKYLGGDEEHTHLVKGLDKALAEKVRREEMRQGDIGEPKVSGDLDELLEDAYAHKQGKSMPKEAQDWQSKNPKTQLGKSVLSYLLHKKNSESKTSSTTSSATQLATSQVKSNPAIQKSLKHSMLTFSLESDVQQWKNAWEVPQISVSVFGTQDIDTTSRKLAPLNHHMISTISKKFDERLSKVKERSKYHTHANGEGKNGPKSDDLALVGGEDKSRRSMTNAKANMKPMDKDDSDDDIFENVGSYVPDVSAPKLSEPEAAATSTDLAADNNGKRSTTADDNGKGNQTHTKEMHTQSKQSIFDNLIPEAARTNATHVHKPQQQQRQQSRLQHNQQNSPPQNRNVIDRDIFGGERSSSPYSIRRGPKSAALEGVSMSSYQGGYGEEMDVDFAGTEDSRGKDKSGKEKEDSGGGDDGKDAGDNEED